MDRISQHDVEILETLYKQPGKVEVVKVRHQRTHQILCMKKIFVSTISEANSIQREYMAMATLNHPSIVSLRGANLGGNDNQITHVEIFMDYFEEGDLEKLISSRVKSRMFFSEEEILNYLTQLVEAYNFLQDKGVAHRDIKPQNIFVMQHGSLLKVGDLGSAVKNVSDSNVTLTGTPMYLSPVLRKAMLSGSQGLTVSHNIYKSDVYSLGMTFLYLASLTPVNDLCVINNLEEKLSLRIENLAGMYPYIKLILKKMLMIDENYRVDFKELAKILNDRNRGIQVTDTQVYNSENRLQEIFAYCEVCKLKKNDEELLIFTSHILCTSCFQNYIQLHTQLS